MKIYCSLLLPELIHEIAHELRQRGLLQGGDGRALELEIYLEVHSKLMHKTMEGCSWIRSSDSYAATRSRSTGGDRSDSGVLCISKRNTEEDQGPRRGVRRGVRQVAGRGRRPQPRQTEGDREVEGSAEEGKLSP